MKFSDLTCGQEPNNIITEERNQYKCNGPTVSAAPKKPCNIFLTK